MKHFLIALGLASSALGGVPAAAQSVPARLTVPKHALWCATSRPLKITDTTDPLFADFVFDRLYEGLEEAALRAQLSSVGIPFAEELRLTAGGEAPPPPAGASPVPPEADATVRSATYVVAVCSVVDPAAPPPPPPAAAEDGTLPAAAQLDRKEVAAQDVYSIHCKVEEEDGCKSRLAALIRSGGIKLPEDMEGRWRVRQALTANSSPTAMIAALTDYKLRPLRTDTASDEPPLNYAVYWLPVEEAKALAAASPPEPVEENEDD